MDVNMEQKQLEKQELEQNDQQDKQQIKEKKVRRKNTERTSGIGFDCGTGNFIIAVSKNNIASFKLERDAFFEIEKNISTISVLTRSKVNYVESENKKFLQIIGSEALNFADFFNKECKRPLANGVISTHEKSALTIVKLMLKQMLGTPITENEICYFSIPAKPIDKDNYNVVYHENILKSFITSFGFEAYSINEALAIVWSNLVEEDYSGIAISWGAGMTNVCLSYKGVSETDHQFSLARGGDFIDSCAGEAVGLKASRMTIIKENGVDLLDPKNREETAIKIYYENLIKYVCSGIEKKLNSTENIPNFKEPISIILSGGTSKAINFDKVFEKEIRTKSLPFQIKDIRLAKDQLNAVAEGCLLNAISH